MRRIRTGPAGLLSLLMLLATLSCGGAGQAPNFRRMQT